MAILTRVGNLILLKIFIRRVLNKKRARYVVAIVKVPNFKFSFSKYAQKMLIFRWL